MHTKLSNPHYPPEIQAETTLVNFTVTEKGLEDQLLALVVRKERQDLAELGEQLVGQQNGFKIKMKELEDNILYKLVTAQVIPSSVYFFHFFPYLTINTTKKTNF